MASKWFDKTKSFLTAGPPPKFVAVEFEGRKLRVVFAEPQRGLPAFRTLALVDAPETLDLKNAAAVGQFIGGALKSLGMPLTRVLMDVPRSQAVLKTLTLPPVENERELPAMVRYQVEKELPFPLDQAVIDFTVDDHYVTDATGEPVEGDAKKPETIDVLVAAVQRSVVEHHEALAEAGGFKLHRLGLRPYADMRCLFATLAREDRKLNILLAHVLPTEVEVSLLIEGGLAFSRSGAIRQHDDEGRNFTPKETLENYLMEVARSAQGALSAHRGRKIDRIYVTGDTGQEKAIAESLTERFRIPCVIVEPGRGLKLKGEVDSRGFVSPLGLAIAHGTAERMPFDFLNPKNPPVERNLKKIRTIAAAAAIGLILIVGFAWGIINRSEATGTLAALRNTYNDLEKQNRPIEKLAQRVKAVEEWKAESHNWLDHWANISSLFPPAGPTADAYITSLRTNPDGSLSLNVKARGSKVITDLSKSLREAGYDVKLGAETVQNDDFGYRYVMAVRLGIDPKQKVELSKLKVERRPLDDGSIEIIRTKGRYVAPPAAPTDQEGEIDAATPDPNDTASRESGGNGERTSGTPEKSGGTSGGPDRTGGNPVRTNGSDEKSSDKTEKTDDKSKSGRPRDPREERSRDRR